MTLSATQRGMAFMLLSTLAFTLMTGIFRGLSDDLHPFEISFFRALFGLVFFAPLFLRQGLAPLRTKRAGLLVVRGMTNATGMLCYFMALKFTPLAKLAALFFAQPLFGTILALLFLGEVIRARRLTALAFGFAGMLIIIQPAGTGLDLGAGLVLASAFVSAIAVVLIKRLSTTESSATITIYTGLVTTPVALAVAIPVWQTPDMVQLAWMFVAGCLGSIGQLSMVRAFALADATAVLPLDFFKLIWAAILGYLAFGETVALSTWLGGTLIFAASIYIAHRERLAQKPGGSDGPAA